MKSRTVICSLALLAASGLAVSCGGDAEAISKADFVAQANALCTTLNEKLAEPQAAITSEEEALEFLGTTLVDELGATTKAIRDLGFPKGDEKLLGGLMDDTDEILADIAKDPAAAAQSSESPFSAINEQLTTYGLTVCGADD